MTLRNLRLVDLLSRKDVPVSWNDTLGREALLAFHFWILDYAADGHRQGFPFDPYVLYLHRRIVRAGTVLGGLLSLDVAPRHTSPALVNLGKHLQEYCADPQIVAAAKLYEQAYQVFGRLRSALRLSAQGTSPLHEPYDLSGDQAREIQSSLDALRVEFREHSKSSTTSAARQLYQIVVKHLDKYWSMLFFPNAMAGRGLLPRTTNRLESHWGRCKRTCRQTHGRRKLTRDFHALPEELMLVPNLSNAEYVRIVLDGNLENLAEKMAATGVAAGAYAAWHRRRSPLNIGRIPRRLLRDATFLDQMVDLCDATWHAIDDRTGLPSL